MPDILITIMWGAIGLVGIYCFLMTIVYLLALLSKGVDYIHARCDGKSKLSKTKFIVWNIVKAVVIVFIAFEAVLLIGTFIRIVFVGG